MTDSDELFFSHGSARRVAEILVATLEKKNPPREVLTLAKRKAAEYKTLSLHAKETMRDKLQSEGLGRLVVQATLELSELNDSLNKSRQSLEETRIAIGELERAAKDDLKALLARRRREGEEEEEQGNTKTTAATGGNDDDVVEKERPISSSRSRSSPPVSPRGIDGGDRRGSRRNAYLDKASHRMEMAVSGSLSDALLISRTGLDALKPCSKTFFRELSKACEPCLSGIETTGGPANNLSPPHGVSIDRLSSWISSQTRRFVTVYFFRLSLTRLPPTATGGGAAGEVFPAGSELSEADWMDLARGLTLVFEAAEKVVSGSVSSTGPTQRDEARAVLPPLETYFVREITPHLQKLLVTLFVPPTSAFPAPSVATRATLLAAVRRSAVVVATHPSFLDSLLPLLKTRCAGALSVMTKEQGAEEAKAAETEIERILKEELGASSYAGTNNNNNVPSN